VIVEAAHRGIFQSTQIAVRGAHGAGGRAVSIIRQGAEEEEAGGGGGRREENASLHAPSGTAFVDAGVRRTGSVNLVCFSAPVRRGDSATRARILGAKNFFHGGSDCSRKQLASLAGLHMS